MKLKYREIAPYREQQRLNQNNKCALCGEDIGDNAVLDHDHKTGLIRQVLHRGCNSLLGKIENNMPRSEMTITRLTTFAERLVTYMQTVHSDKVHPTHKTREERKMGMGRGRGRGKKPPKR